METPVQEHYFQSFSGGSVVKNLSANARDNGLIPSLGRTTRLVPNNCWACAPEPGSHNYRAHVLQLLKPEHPRTVLLTKRSQHNEKHIHHNWRVAQLAATRENLAQQRTPRTSKNKQIATVKSLNHLWLFVTPWTAARKAPLSSAVSQTWLKFRSTESVMLSNHLIFYRPSSTAPFSFCLQSFPA